MVEINLGVKHGLEQAENYSLSDGMKYIRHNRANKS